VADETATTFSAPGDPPIDLLIVEDERISRRALASLLAASGYTPAAFESAEQALSYLEARSDVPLTLVDVDLPGISGLELITRLQQLHPDVRAVILSAADSDRIRPYCRRTVVYLRKPIDFPRLLKLMKSLRN
jgi:CheY-like chemotaxis protein